MTAAAPLLQLRQLGLGFSLNGSQLSVLSDLDISIGPSEFVAIVGPSGCGKSTLLRVINGLVKPSAGSMQWSTQTTPAPARLRSAMVFQSPRLLPWKTVIQNVAVSLRCRGVASKESLDRAAELLLVVDIADFANAYPRQLSGGMQQRVNLARALATAPDMILLDEPFAALDSLTRESMQEYLAKIWASQNRAALLVTHQVDEAIFLADRVIVLSPRPARIVADIPITFAKPRHLSLKQQPEFVYLTNEIVSALRGPSHEQDDGAGETDGGASAFLDSAAQAQ
jgi:NitT/TauT family transport system ATP-binding protein